MNLFKTLFDFDKEKEYSASLISNKEQFLFEKPIQEFKPPRYNRISSSLVILIHFVKYFIETAFVIKHMANN